MDKKTRQRINNLLNKYFKWFVLLLIILLLIGGYYLVVKPKYRETMNSLKTHLRLEKQNYLVKKEKLAKIKKLVSVYKDTKEEKIEKINNFLPSDHNYERLFTEVDSLVSRNGLLLGKLSIKVAGERIDREGRRDRRSREKREANITRDLPSGVEKAELNVNVLGADYNSLKSLLTSLENNMRLMDVISVKFDPENGSAELLVWTYYFNEEYFEIRKDIKL